jgi:uncharacterized protein YegJ (DUF2314 family)
MRDVLTFLIIILISFSCDNSKKKIVRSGDPNIYRLPGNDVDMNNAIYKAKNSFNDFLEALKHPQKDQTGFSVKVQYPTDEGYEHIWISDVKLDSGKIIGYVGNIPNKIKNLIYGQRVIIYENEISDWMYLDSNYLVGGFTIRVLYDKMTEAEKKQYEAETSFKIK